MTFGNENLNGNGAGSESPMDMVLDNLGMDDELVNSLNDDGLGDPGDLGDDSLDPGLSQTPQPQQRQTPDQSRQQFPQQQPQPQQRPFPQNAEVRPDQRGNLVDANGRVVAKAGFEARMYQTADHARRALGVEQQKSQDYAQRLNRAVEIGQQIHTQLEAVKAQLNDRNGAAARLGLNDQESVQAMQYMAEAKANPVQFIKKLLTLAASQGVDLTQIGLAPGGVDARSLVDIVKNEIKTAMGPLQARTAQEQQTAREQAQAAETYREVENETKSFFRDNPDAAQHIPVFHAILSEPKFQHMSLGEVWARIQLNQMRMAQNPQAARMNPQPRRNIPAGRGQPMQRSNGDMAPPTASYDQILRETLDGLGVV